MFHRTRLFALWLTAALVGVLGLAGCNGPTTTATDGSAEADNSATSDILELTEQSAESDQTEFPQESVYMKVEEAQVVLASLLEDEVLNPDGSLINEGMLIVPLTGLPDEDEQAQLDGGEPMIIGAIIIVDENPLEMEVDTILAIQCDISPYCLGLNPDGEPQTELSPVVMEELGEPAENPVVTLGSWFCIPWDSREWCIG